jgi:NitT/TauT family transport system permease protein
MRWLMAGHAAVNHHSGHSSWHLAEISTRLSSYPATLEVMFAGYGAGCVLGIFCGLVFGLVRPLEQALSPYFFAAYSLPTIALIPLLIILYWTGSESKIALVTLVVFFMLFSSTLDGACSVDLDVVQTLQLMGATRGEVVRKVVIPAIRPWIFTSMRIAVNTAFSNTLLARLSQLAAGLGNFVPAWRR